jgi:outer membrane protein W
MLSLTAVLLAGSAAAQDQQFAIRFGLNIVDPTSDSTVDGDNFELDTKSGGEFGFEWYFHPRVGFEVATTGSANAEIKTGGDEITGGTFTTFTLGINGHVVRSEKVDFGLGLVAGRARYADFDVAGSTVIVEQETDTTWGAQAFVDMTVSRKWAVDVGIKYLQTQLNFETGEQLDYNPVIFRVMGVYRWGRAK